MLHTIHIVFEIFGGIAIICLLLAVGRHKERILDVEKKYVERFKIIETRFNDKLQAIRLELTTAKADVKEGIDVDETIATDVAAAETEIKPIIELGTSLL